jgi:hypothetical protein
MNYVNVYGEVFIGGYGMIESAGNWIVRRL